MEKFLLSGFAIIESSRKIDKNIIPVFEKAFHRNKKLFGRIPGKFRIIMCNTEKEFMQNGKTHYQPWASAVVLNNGTLVTRAPDFIRKLAKKMGERLISMTS